MIFMLVVIKVMIKNITEIEGKQCSGSKQCTRAKQCAGANKQCSTVQPSMWRCHINMKKRL